MVLKFAKINPLLELLVICQEYLCVPLHISLNMEPEYGYHMHFRNRFPVAKKTTYRPEVTSLCWNPNPEPLGFNAMIALSTNKELRLTGICSDNKWKMLHQQKAQIQAMEWNSLGHLAVCTGSEGVSQIFILEYQNASFRKIQNFQVTGIVKTMSWELSGNFLVAPSDVSKLYILSRLADGRYTMKRDLECPYATSFVAEVHPINSIILTAARASNEVLVWSRDNEVGTWNVSSKLSCLHEQYDCSTCFDRITNMKFSKDGNSIAMLGNKGLNLFSYATSNGEPRLEHVGLETNDGKKRSKGGRSLAQHCEAAISLDWSSNDTLLTGSSVGTICIHRKIEDSFEVEYFRWNDVHSVNTTGRVTCVSWDPSAPYMFTHGGVDGFVILWELKPSSIPKKDIRSYPMELNYFKPQWREGVKDNRVRDVSPVSSIEESDVLFYVHNDSDHHSAHEHIHEAAALKEFINAFQLLVDKLGGGKKI